MAHLWLTSYPEYDKYMPLRLTTGPRVVLRSDFVKRKSVYKKEGTRRSVCTAVPRGLKDEEVEVEAMG